MYYHFLWSIRSWGASYTRSIQNTCTESARYSNLEFTASIYGELKNGAFIGRVLSEREIELYLKLVRRIKEPVLHRLPINIHKDTIELVKSLTYRFRTSDRTTPFKTAKWRDRWDHYKFKLENEVVLPVRKVSRRLFWVFEDKWFVRI